MEFALSSELEELRQRTAKFVREHCIPLEEPRSSFDEHENIPLDKLDILRTKAKTAGLWAPQMPKELGGMGLKMAEQAVIYEEANYSIFGPAALNCAAPDDGNMRLLWMVGNQAQKEKWLQPVIDGKVRSAFVMTEPHPGSGSDPAGMMRTKAEKKGDKWVVVEWNWVMGHYRTPDYVRKRKRVDVSDNEQPPVDSSWYEITGNEGGG